MKYIQDNPGSWEAHVHKESISGNNKRSAKCSWCNSSEHNKRNCTILVDDIIALTRKNANYRKHYLEFCKNKGVGIGALVKVDHVWGYDAHPSNKYELYNNALGLITDIDWNKVNYPLDSIENITIEFMSIYDYGGVTKTKYNHIIYPITIANQFGKQKSNYYDNVVSSMRFDIVSPGHVMIDNETEWLKGTIAKKEFDRSIRGQKKRNHRWAQNKLEQNNDF